MQSDVKAAAATVSGTLVGHPARVKSLVITTSGVAGSVVLRDGGGTGAAVLTINTPAVAGLVSVDIPGAGVRCERDVHATLTNVAAVTAFYA